MSDTTSILTETRGRAGLVRINRPKALNALNSAVMSELMDALEAFDGDPAVGAIVITGDERAFSAGADIKEMSGASAIDMLLRDAISRWDRLRRI
jgi:enoyl-CoA hydratase